MDTSILRAVGFVHTHVHSAYSLREGAIPVETLVKYAKADAQPAIAITDTNNLFAALEFSEKAAKSGLQPLIGAQLTVDFGDAPAGRLNRLGRAPLVLIAQDERGYMNLMRLVSRVWLDPTDGEEAHVRCDGLDDIAGLIALTGGASGAIDRLLAVGAADLAQARLKRLADLFGDRLYVELQRHESRDHEPALLDLAYRLSLPLVATNEPYFAAASDFAAQDALLAIAEGALLTTPERRQLTPQHRLKTRAEMVKLFADLPEATDNSVEIALRCAYRPRTRKPILPRFSLPGAEALDEEAELRRQAAVGLETLMARYGLAPGFTPAQYRERLDFELSVIVGMKFPGYFLIVADFIKWAKAHDIPVGPGRGSGAGSLVAYALTITELDPMRFGLLFERFLNPERISMPDFDIDFCQERRDEVIAYVRERYGHDRVAQIITFGSFLARGVLRNVGRVLEMPLGQVDRLAKLVPQNPAKPVTLKEAVRDEPKLQEAAASDPKVAQMLAIAEKLEGLLSNASTHAAGLVIGDRPLVELVPLYKDPKSVMPATQFNMKWVEPAGLVKFDFLGLKTMTVLRHAQRLVALKGVEVELGAIPLDDKKTYEMLGRGETVGVFQVESAGMRKALVEMRADRFEDLIALVALYRPGPMANIPTYCARKLGRETPEYMHENTEPILKETFGVIIYQEQVMQIAQALSGYSLGEADMLRRAMGKKIKAEMDAQRARFVNGAVERGVAKAKADEIFDLLAKFADYGFNKSHAAAYALISYWTAWYKANHAAEFLAASMTLDKGNTDKLAEFRADARRIGIRVAAPNINRSGADFDVRYDVPGVPTERPAPGVPTERPAPGVPTERPAEGATILYALGAIKGVGSAQAQTVADSRTKDGAFRSLADFARRVDPKQVNKKALECLASAGAFDEIEPDRTLAFASVEPMLGLANRRAEERLSNQSALFGDAPETQIKVKTAPWSTSERLQREFDAIGFFLSGHPLEAHEAVIKRMGAIRWSEFCTRVRAGDTTHRLAANVLDKFERRTKAGKKMGVVTLSDPTGQYEAVMFEESLLEYRDLLEKGADVIVTLSARLEGEDVRASISRVEKLAEAAARSHKGLKVFVRDETPLPSIAERLKTRGDGQIKLVVILGPGEEEVEIELPGRFAVTGALAGALKAVAGVVQVEHV